MKWNIEAFKNTLVAMIIWMAIFFILLSVFLLLDRLGIIIIK